MALTYHEELRRVDLLQRWTELVVVAMTARLAPTACCNLAWRWARHFLLQLRVRDHAMPLRFLAAMLARLLLEVWSSSCDVETRLGIDLEASDSRPQSVSKARLSILNRDANVRSSMLISFVAQNGNPDLQPPLHTDSQTVFHTVRRNTFPCARKSPPNPHCISDLGTTHTVCIRPTCLIARPVSESLSGSDGIRSVRLGIAVFLYVPPVGRAAMRMLYVVPIDSVLINLHVRMRMSGRQLVSADAVATRVYLRDIRILYSSLLYRLVSTDNQLRLLSACYLLRPQHARHTSPHACTQRCIEVISCPYSNVKQMTDVTL